MKNLAPQSQLPLPVLIRFSKILVGHPTLSVVQIARILVQLATMRVKDRLANQLHISFWAKTWFRSWTVANHLSKKSQILIQLRRESRSQLSRPSNLSSWTKSPLVIQFRLSLRQWKRKQIRLLHFQMVAGSAPPAKTIILVEGTSVIVVRSKRPRMILLESQSICSDSNVKSNRKLKLRNQNKVKVIRRFKYLLLHLWRRVRFKAKRTSLMRSELETGFVWSALIWTFPSGWLATGVSETEPLGPVSLKTRTSFRSSNPLDVQRSTFALTPRVSTAKQLVSSPAWVTKQTKSIFLLQQKLLVPCRCKIDLKSKASFVDFRINPKWVSQESMYLTQSKKNNPAASERWKECSRRATGDEIEQELPDNSPAAFAQLVR
jgi:hypothetical protein